VGRQKEKVSAVGFEFAQEVWMASEAVPAHVPAELVREWEHVLADNALDDPYAPTEEVAKNYPPIFYAPAPPGAMRPGNWVVSRYEDIREVFQNTDRYSSVGLYPYPPMVGETFRAIPLSFDPPEHDKYRVLLNPWFSPKAVTELEPKIHAVVDELITGFLENGECDVAYDFSRVYPVRVFMGLMGFPEDKLDEFLSWVHPMHFELDNPERTTWAISSAIAYIRSFIDEVRAAPPSDMLASRILNGKVDGRPLTEEEMLGTIFFLWDGGMDTVAATSTLSFRRLALDAALQGRLRANPDLIPEAIEEFLRMNPTVNTARVAKVDHEMHGVTIKAGDRVLCLIAAGNFDAREFDDPRSFRTDRNSNRHLTFIAGPHRCLGSHLARREMKIALAEFLRRVPPFRLKPGADRTVAPHMQSMRHLPIVWDPKA
jgi:cytochrome P450